MTRADLVSKIADITQMKKVEIDTVIDALVEVVHKEVKKGERVPITDLGIFSAKKRAARRGVNPQTKAPIKIGAAVVPQFSASKTFKEILNK